jgi:hypothetical protein
MINGVHFFCVPDGNGDNLFCNVHYTENSKKHPMHMALAESMENNT